MKIVDLHDHPIINLILNFIGLAFFWAPMLAFFEDIMEWTRNLFEPETMIGELLVAEAGAMLAWALVMVGLFSLIYFGVLVRNVIEARRK